MYEKFQKLLDEKNVTANRVAKATGIDRSAFTHWKKRSLLWICYLTLEKGGNKVVIFQA